MKFKKISMSIFSSRPQAMNIDSMSTPLNQSQGLNNLKIKISTNPREYFSKFSEKTKNTLKNFIAEYLRTSKWPREEDFPALLNIPDEVATIRSFSFIELRDEIFPALDKNFETTSNLALEFYRRFLETVGKFLN